MRHRIVSGAWLPAIAAAVFYALFLAPDCASACSCGFPAGASPQELVRQELAGSDAVFSGEVTEIEEPSPITSSDAPVTVTLRVSEAWKGAAGRETMNVKTAASDASCGYPFVEGESYVVFASEGIFYDEGDLEVALCGSTKPLSKAGKELAVLGPGSAPADTPAAGDRLPETGGDRRGLFSTDRTFLLASGVVATVLAAAFVRSAGGRRDRR